MSKKTSLPSEPPVRCIRLVVPQRGEKWFHRLYGTVEIIKVIKSTGDVECDTCCGWRKLRLATLTQANTERHNDRISDREEGAPE